MFSDTGSNADSFKLCLTRSVWEKLVDAARAEKAAQTFGLRAFMLFRPYGSTQSNLLTEAVEIPVRLVKPDSPSGPIFRWDYSQNDRGEFYPQGKGRLTNRGTAIIQSRLELTLHYAFWMGAEYGISGSGGYHLNLWMDNDLKPIYRAYYVNGKGKPCTDGEFIDLQVEVV